MNEKRLVFLAGEPKGIIRIIIALVFLFFFIPIVTILLGVMGYIPYDISQTVFFSMLGFELVDLIAISALVVIYMRGKKPAPSELRVTTNPAKIIADGKSKSTITVELINAEGKPIAAAEDTIVALKTTLGSVSSTMVISKGEKSGSSVLISPQEGGTATITATSKGLRGGRSEVILAERKVEVEKRRYCMHCGAQMSPGAKFCSMCGKQPPSGAQDVKLCKNCSAAIPTVARFCSECGANQPT